MKSNSPARRPGFQLFRLLTFGLLALLLGTTNSVRAVTGPDLIIDIVNSGGFIEGGTGTYTITVTNQGDMSTNDTQVRVDIIVDTNYLSPLTLTGTDWNCDLANMFCTRSDVLGSAQSYAAITLTVDVADNTPDFLVSEADVTGGGDVDTGNNIDLDNTAITQLADLIVVKSHVEDAIIVNDGTNTVYYDFAEGDQDKTYTIKVQNAGQGATSGTVTVTDTLPAGLSNGTLSGTGWNCIGLTCTRSDLLAGDDDGAPPYPEYPPLTLTVDVDVDAPEDLTNSVSVSGGGEIITTNNTDDDPTRIQPKPDLVITNVYLNPAVPAPNEAFEVYVEVTNQGGAGSESIVYRDVYVGAPPTIDPVTGCPIEGSVYYRGELNDAIPAGVSDTKPVSISYIDYSTTPPQVVDGLPGGTYQIWVYTDATCINDEGNENNNIVGPITIQVTGNGTLTFQSTGAYDGWVLESGETTNAGRRKNAGSSIIYIGDDAHNRQYRGFLSFDTSGLPDNAIITSVNLKFKYAGVVGTLPFRTHRNLIVDIKNGAFSNLIGLASRDFNAAANRNRAMSFNRTQVSGWYSRFLNAAYFPYINRTGVTQFRLRFVKDDNNDFGRDVLKIYSGNSIVANRPVLIIQYTVP